MTFTVYALVGAAALLLLGAAAVAVRGFGPVYEKQIGRQPRRRIPSTRVSKARRRPVDRAVAPYFARGVAAIDEETNRTRRVVIDPDLGPLVMPDEDE
jgi:hypothetical protein